MFKGVKNEEILSIFENIRNKFDFLLITSCKNDINTDNFDKWHFSNKNIHNKPFNKSLNSELANHLPNWIILSPNSSFSVLANGATRLNQASFAWGNSVVETFCDSNNCIIDFQTTGVNDFATRLQAVYTGTTNGNGEFLMFCNRFYIRYSNGVNQFDMGYLNDNESFLRGRNLNTYIRFHQNSEIYYFVNNAQRFIMSSSGRMWTTGGFQTGSDRRLKKNIVDISNALQTINKLQVKEFDKKMSLNCEEEEEEECIMTHEIGFIAQEVEAIKELEFCVSSSKLNDTKGLNGSCIFALNVKATQELYEIVMKQQEEIEKLKERLSYLNI